MGKFNKFDAIGILFGLLLYYIWFFVIFLFQNIFLARKEVIHGTVVYYISNNDLVTWLSDGLLLFLHTVRALHHHKEGIRSQNSQKCDSGFYSMVGCADNFKFSRV